MENRKVIVVGVDAMDPHISRYYEEQGFMPNLTKLRKMGSISKGFEMIGGHPTVTPPMWTTLATGASPYVHGVTDFFKRGEKLGDCVYNFDSRNCKAEQYWNVTAEAGLKTLVWHWPGSAWPPSSDSPNLMVVDGTQPEGVNMGNAEIDEEGILIASIDTPEVLYRSKSGVNTDIPCYISGMEFNDDKLHDTMAEFVGSDVVHKVRMPDSPKTDFANIPIGIGYSPIKPATGWANAPEDAKECTLLLSDGLIHRPCQILKNEAGIYDTLCIFKNKKAEKPIATLKYNVYEQDIIDDAITKEDKHIPASRNMRILEMTEDGSLLKLWFSAAMDFHNDTLWHPKHLLPEIIEHVGYPQPVALAGGHDEKLLADCMRRTWDSAAEWQAASIKYLIDTYNLDVVFSHFHSVDLQGHMLVQFLKNGSKLPAEKLQELYKEVMIQADRYIGEFIPLIEKGWTIFVVSDHGQACPEEHASPLAMTPYIDGVSMVKLGYTVLKKDEAGNDLPDIDWSKTKAINWRMGEIWLNVKGREPNGIVDPADKYEVEEDILTDLYAMRDEKTGHRLVSLALRNKDAVLLGMGGEGAADIFFYSAEKFVGDHGDSLSTVDGACETSVRSIFVAAGPGIKKDFVTTRVVHHIDLVPTMVSLLNTRMPHECEGAPVYQILEEYK